MPPLIYLPPYQYAQGGQASPPSTDAYWPQTTLLLHMEGVEAGTTFTDEKGHTVVSLQTTTRTVQAKFGTSSAAFYGTGCLYIADSADFQFGTSDFTIEFWIYPADLMSVQELFVKGLGIQIYLWNGYICLALSAANNGSYFINNNQDPALAITGNKWSHIALVKDNTGYILFLDGVPTFLGNPTTYVDTGVDNVMLGAYNYSTYPYFGYMDDVRITKGLARYSNNVFTVPSAAFPNS